MALIIDLCFSIGCPDFSLSTWHEIFGFSIDQRRRDCKIFWQDSYNKHSIKSCWFNRSIIRSIDQSIWMLAGRCLIFYAVFYLMLGIFCNMVWWTWWRIIRNPDDPIYSADDGMAWTPGGSQHTQLYKTLCIHCSYTVLQRVYICDNNNQ